MSPKDHGELDILPRLAAPEQRSVGVSQIERRARDLSGREVSRVFAKRRNYVVYTAIVEGDPDASEGARDEEVFIQFSDDVDEATEQMARLAPLTGLRQKLDYLSRGLPKTRCYHLGQIGWAMRLGLEGQEGDAREVLAGAILTATEERARIGRRLYLSYALRYAFGGAAVLGTGAWALCSFAGNGAGGCDLLGGAAAGAMGALLSISMAIRGRTVAPDHDVETNRWDAILRLTMGTLSAAALILLLTSTIIGPVSINGSDFSGAGLADSWRAVLAVGFAAGFLERLVPDLLESRMHQRPTASELANTASPG